MTWIVWHYFWYWFFYRYPAFCLIIDRLNLHQLKVGCSWTSDVRQKKSLTALKCDDCGLKLLTASHSWAMIHYFRCRRECFLSRVCIYVCVRVNCIIVLSIVFSSLISLRRIYWQAMSLSYCETSQESSIFLLHAGSNICLYWHRTQCKS